jgi:hypothetical protein
MWGSSSSGGAAGAALAGIPGGAWSAGKAAGAGGGAPKAQAAVAAFAIDIWAAASCHCVEKYITEYVADASDPPGMKSRWNCTPTDDTSGNWDGMCDCWGVFVGPDGKEFANPDAIPMDAADAFGHDCDKRESLPDSPLVKIDVQAGIGDYGPPGTVTNCSEYAVVVWSNQYGFSALGPMTLTGCTSTNASQDWDYVLVGGQWWKVRSGFTLTVLDDGTVSCFPGACCQASGYGVPC